MGPDGWGKTVFFRNGSPLSLADAKIFRVFLTPSIYRNTTELLVVVVGIISWRKEEWKGVHSDDKEGLRDLNRGG